MVKRANGEGSIYRQRDDLYAAYITLDDGKRKYFYGKTKSIVREKLNKALLEKQQGMLVVSAQQPLGQYLIEWLEYTVKPSLRARSYERYEEVTRIHIIPRLGKVKLQDLRPQHIKALLAEKLNVHFSPATVGIIHRVLHKSLDDAVRSGLLNRNVCDAVRPPRERHKEMKALTPQQARRLIKAAEGHPLEALFVLALVTGMRRGELFGLKWQDVDLEEGVLHIRRILSRVPTKLRGDDKSVYVEAETKTEKSRRSILLVPLAIGVLKRHRSRQEETKLLAGASWQEHGYVFCSPDGTSLNPNHVSSFQLKRLLESAGLPDIRFHDLRHSAATLLLSLGVHPKVVQEILGHSEISMTLDTYSHVLPTMQQEAMSKLHLLFSLEDVGIEENGENGEEENEQDGEEGDLEE